MSEIAFSQIRNFNPELLADRPRAPRDWHFVGGRSQDWHDPYGSHQVYGPCPVCNDQTKGKEYCLACDATGLDGLVEFPGRPVSFWSEEEKPKARPTTPEDLGYSVIELPDGQVLWKSLENRELPNLDGHSSFRGLDPQWFNKRIKNRKDQQA